MNSINPLQAGKRQAQQERGCACEGAASNDPKCHAFTGAATD